MSNFFDFMLLHGPRNPLPICLHDWKGYGCIVYGTSGLGRSTGYNNKTTKNLIAFCDALLCEYFLNLIECACCLLRENKSGLIPGQSMWDLFLTKWQ